MTTVSKLGWRDRLAKLPPDQQEKVKGVIRKVLKGRRSPSPANPTPKS